MNVRNASQGLGVLLVTAVLTACGSSGSTTSTTVTSTTTSTAVVSEEAAILDAYRQSWTDFMAAADPPNPESQTLANHITGKALQKAQVGFLNNRAAGHVVRGTLDLAPKLTSHSGDQAIVTDCYFDHTVLYEAKTGKVLGKEDTERQLVVATMQRENGTWKVAGVEHKGQGCAVTP